MSHFGDMASLPVRTYDEEMRFLEQLSDSKWRIRPGFVPNMRVPGTFYVNAALQELVFSELAQCTQWCVNIPYQAVSQYGST